MEKHGYSLISNHESKSNETVYYLRTLETFSDMTSLREHVYAIPETVSIEITVPCDLTGNIEKQELAQRLAHLRRKVHAMHPFCRVVVNAGEVETDVKITNATLAEEIELREDIAAKIEHWVYRLR
ncbi:hypothetical protein [Photorhabdus bodei]|uniref:Uncharacterized protein n=1 Tax=Photorhabdus bodei TaxID=2029681 RepID=A0AAW6BQC6_9GAMM|nr:hypothetical protein [Photorhabdus bodei]MDB6373884.1 hypothetical protein [Photorhabdus bodei]